MVIQLKRRVRRSGNKKDHEKRVFLHKLNKKKKNEEM